MRLMVRADNPGGRARFITILRNQNLLDTNNDLLAGLRIDEIGEMELSKAVVQGGVLLTPTVFDDAYHANIWIVEPLRGQLRRGWEAIQEGDPYADNGFGDAIVKAGTFRAKQLLAGRKVPGGWVINNVMFIRADTIATPRRVWA